MKLSIEQVEEVLQKNKGVNETAKQQILSDLKEIYTSSVPPKQKAVKKKFVLLANVDKESQKIKEVVENLQLFLVQIPEEDQHDKIVDQFPAIRNDFNDSKKGRKDPAKTKIDIIEHVPNKFLREHGVMRKSTEPLVIVPFVGSDTI